MATLIGVLIATHWSLGLVFAVIWLGVALLFRYSSLSAICAAVITPVYSWLFLGSPVISASIALMAVALLWRHRSNIKNLMAGREDKIGAKKA